MASQEDYESGIKEELDLKAYGDSSLKQSNVSLASGSSSSSSPEEEPGRTEPAKPLISHKASHNSYVELHELVMDKNNEFRWMEASHWIKLEEDFEEMGHWGRPHLSYLTFQSLLEVRKAFSKGTVLLDLQERSLSGIANQVLSQMIYEGKLKPDDQEVLLRTLLLQHSHPNESASLNTLSPARVQRTDAKDSDQPLLQEHHQIEMKTFFNGSEQGESSKSDFKKHLLDKVPPDAEATLGLVDKISDKILKNCCSDIRIYAGH